MEIRAHIPIYKRLVDYYRTKINNQEYKPGSRIDSINRIRERHSVSRETAKLVLKKLIEEGLVVSIMGKGTFVNTPVSIKKKWAVVIPFYSSNIEQLIENLTEEAAEQERQLDYTLHYNNHHEEIRIVGSLIQDGYEAIIVVPNYNESLTADFYRNLVPGKSKLILADNTMAGSYFKYVVQSYDLGVIRAIEYLAEWNNGNFLLIENEIWKGRNMIFELIEQTIYSLLYTKYTDRTLTVITSLNELTPLLLEQKQIGGILSIHDTDSIKIINRLNKWDITVPDQVALVSYGNTELTELFNPPITVIDCGYEEMAKNISKLIYKDEEISNKQIVISPQLIVRNT